MLRGLALLALLAPAASRECLRNDVIVATGKAPPFYKLRDCTSLNLEFTSLGAKGVEALCKALRGNGRLLSLRLHNANVGDQGAAILAKALNFSALETLEIWHGDMSGAGAAALASSGYAGLRNLDLRHNHVGDEAALALAGALSRGELKLTEIHLQHTGVGPVGAKALADAMAQEGATLTSLDLSRNLIGDAAAKKLFKVAEANEAVRHIGLAKCKIDANLEHRLNTMLANRRPPPPPPSPPARPPPPSPPPPFLISWLETHDLDVKEYFPLFRKMGFSKKATPADSFVGRTLDDIDPKNAAKATRQQRARIDAALMATTVAAESERQAGEVEGSAWPGEEKEELRRRRRR